jgi:flagellar hook-associated protein 1 FlgK
VINQMVAVQTQPLDALAGSSPTDAYQQLVTSIGEQVQTRQSSKTSMDSILQQLQDHRDQVSGVNINDEAAKLMVFQNMFQALAKYLSTSQNTMQALLQAM